MPDLLIKDAELQQLDKLLKPVPTEFGYNLVVFFQSVSAARQKEAKDAADAEALRQRELSKETQPTNVGVDNEHLPF